ncbi:helix-turn-helix transcriptional regulator [Amycolatopsis sp. DSM 110486]|uniref:helix-turn-helix domain-containing protein n=1 Tax=Amycolatopsis sp. DSM 110486 TaxID=2865832 RepID=UPI001C69DD2D|nr:helix-turn-helix transcriptional regulator [Amycolatopsis sp. DSM 110486]QYN21018.1 helix-turn-helix domain-containing protein [Amycolatopsis sp. DSM 110486]
MQIPNDRLRSLRQATGLKVGAFSELVQCSPSHLTNCENGNRNPSPELAELIAREFSRLLKTRVTVADFMPTGAGTVPDRPHPQPKPPTKPPTREPTKKAPKRVADGVAA